MVSEGAVDHLGQGFFAKFFVGLWQDAHGSEVRRL